MDHDHQLRQFKLYMYIFILTSICILNAAISGHRPCDVRNQVANCTYRFLDHIPQDLPTNLEAFLLSGNNLTNIKAHSFRKYSNLSYLDLSNNRIRKLGNYSFCGLNKLTILNLENNVLNLTHAVYPTLCFAGLNYLKKLLLGGNILLEWFVYQQPSFYYPDVSLSELVSLEELTIDGLPDTVFGPGFRAMNNLHRLYFKQCYLNYIQEDMFTNTPHITHLSMRNCHIYDSHYNSLAKLPNINSLDISYNMDLGMNNVTHIFFGLQNTSLRILNVSRITPRYATCVIPPVDIFQHLTKTSLDELICEHNSLVLLKPGTLDYFPPSVKYLSLRYNQFKYGQYLYEVNKLRGVIRADISDITLGHFLVEPSGSDPKLWPRLTLPQQLEEVIFRNVIIHASIPPAIFMNNSIKAIDLSQNGVSMWKGPIKGLEKTERLDLSMNYCYKVSSYFFQSFPLLRVLNVSNNYMGETLKEPSSRSLFDSLGKLEILDMSKNRLRFIPKTLFTKTMMLKNLNISNNQLFQFDLDIGNTNLFLASLQGNELRSIPPHSRNVLDILNAKHSLEIGLLNNPLLCTCETLDFVLWMFDTKLQFQNLSSYTCTDEANEIKILDKSFALAKKDRCKSYAGLAFGGGCAIIFFLSVGVVGLIYRYRWKIKYLYYVAKDRYNLRRQDDEERNFTYDAFISYANEDLDFVDTLMTHLEGQGKRLCVHHRDFRLGEPIGSNIVKAIQNSKHTVLILSENFLASDWCRYEFEMARMEAVYASRSVLFVVKIGEVSGAAVPRELLYMMKSESYIEYPDDAQDQATFWVNLCEAVD